MFDLLCHLLLVIVLILWIVELGRRLRSPNALSIPRPTPESSDRHMSAVLERPGNNDQMMELLNHVGPQLNPENSDRHTSDVLEKPGSNDQMTERRNDNFTTESFVQIGPQLNRPQLNRPLPQRHEVYTVPIRHDYDLGNTEQAAMARSKGFDYWVTEPRTEKSEIMCSKAAMPIGAVMGDLDPISKGKVLNLGRFSLFPDVFGKEKELAKLNGKDYWCYGRHPSNPVFHTETGNGVCCWQDCV